MSSRAERRWKPREFAWSKSGQLPHKTEAEGAFLTSGVTQSRDRDRVGDSSYAFFLTGEVLATTNYARPAPISISKVISIPAALTMSPE